MSKLTFGNFKLLHVLGQESGDKTNFSSIRLPLNT
jgi:hypothetical protein